MVDRKATRQMLVRGIPLRRSLGTFLGAACCALVVAACSSSGGNPAASNSGGGGTGGASDSGGGGKTYHFKLSSNSAAADPVTLALQAFAKKVDADTHGQVTFTVYPNLELGGEDVELPALESGSINLAALSDGIISTQVPQVGVLDLPYMFSSLSQEKTLLAGQLGQKLDALIEPKNVKVLAWMTSGQRVIISRKPLESLSDFKGLKIRVPQSDVSVSLFKALGANPATLGYPQTYPALQSGVVDAVEVGAKPIYDAKFWEVVKNLTLSYHQQTSAILMMNSGDFNSLPPDFQKIVLSDAQSAASAEWPADEKLNNQAVHQMQQNGVKVHKIDLGPLKSATSGLRQSLASQFGASDLLALIPQS